LDFGAIAIALAMAIWQGHCLIYGQAYFQVDESECNFTPGYSVEFLGFHWPPHFHLPPPDRSPFPISHYQPLPFGPKKRGAEHQLAGSFGQQNASLECSWQIARETSLGMSCQPATGDWRLVTGNWKLVTGSWQTGVKAVSAPLWPLNFGVALQGTLSEMISAPKSTKNSYHNQMYDIFLKYSTVKIYKWT